MITVIDGENRRVLENVIELHVLVNGEQAYGVSVVLAVVKELREDRFNVGRWVVLNELVVPVSMIEYLMRHPALILAIDKII